MRIQTIFTVEPKPWKECSRGSIARITACCVGILVVLIGLFAILADQKILINSLESIGTVGGSVFIGTGILACFFGGVYLKARPIEKKLAPIVSKPIKLVVDFSDDESDMMFFEVDPKKPLRDLKWEIFRRKGIPITKQHYFKKRGDYEGFVSENTLEERGITSGETFLRLVYYAEVNKPIKIVLRINSETFSFELDCKNPTDFLRDQIYDVVDTLPEKYDLIDEETNEKLGGEFPANRNHLKLKLVPIPS